MSIIHDDDTTRQQVSAGRTRYVAHTDHAMVAVWDFAGPQDEPDPPHHHPHEQITYVAAGDVLFFLDGAPHRLTVGDLITVPPDVPHAIQPLSEHVRLVDTFTPLREDFLEG